MKRISGFILLLIIAISVSGQQVDRHVISSGGGQFQNNLISMDWTLGEPVILTFENDNAILTQGFHQDYLRITEIEDLIEESFEIKVFPNPASSFIHLKISNEETLQPFIQLYDLHGKQLLNKQLAPSNKIDEQIELTGFPNGTYILKVTVSGGKQYKSYKVQKVQ